MATSSYSNNKAKVYPLYGGTFPMSIKWCKILIMATLDGRLYWILHKQKSHGHQGRAIEQSHLYISLRGTLTAESSKCQSSTFSFAFLIDCLELGWMSLWRHSSLCLALNWWNKICPIYKQKNYNFWLPLHSLIGGKSRENAHTKLTHKHTGHTKPSTHGKCGCPES